MNNLEEELLELLLKDFKEEIAKSKKINDILNITKEGTANFADSLLFAKECGKCIEKAFRNNISDDVLPDKKMPYDLAKLLIESITKENYEIVTSQCTSVQTTLNKKANIGLKSIKPKYNEEKVEGIITYISNAKVYSEKEESFLDTLSTNSKSIVDDHVRMNADFHYNAGLSPKIIRTAVGSTCKWCQSLAGVYDYSKVSNTGNDVFKRHANCDCTVVYDPSNGSTKVQNVWNKKIEYRKNDVEIKKRIDKIKLLELKEKDEFSRGLAIRKGNIYRIPTKGSENVSINTLNLIDSTMHDLFKEIPKLNGRINEIIFEDLGDDVARASINQKFEMKLKFNTKYFNDDRVLKAMLTNQPKTLSPKNGLYGYIKHEYAHFLEYQYCISKEDGFFNIWEAIKSGKYADELLNEALEYCNLQRDYVIIMSMISFLATMNSSEAIAEAYSNDMDNELTKIIKGLVIKKWR